MPFCEHHGSRNFITAREMIQPGIGCSLPLTVNRYQNRPCLQTRPFRLWSLGSKACGPYAFRGLHGIANGTVYHKLAAKVTSQNLCAQCVAATSFYIVSLRGAMANGRLYPAAFWWDASTNCGGFLPILKEIPTRVLGSSFLGFVHEQAPVIALCLMPFLFKVTVGCTGLKGMKSRWLLLYSWW